MKSNSFVKSLGLFICTFIVSYFIGSFLWSVFITNTLYLPTDTSGFPLDFIAPVLGVPFVQEKFGERYLNGSTGQMLFVIWLMFVILIFVLNFLLLKGSKWYFHKLIKESQAK